MKNEVTITIDAKLDVDEMTAKCALALVEFYCNSNNIFLCCDKNIDGTHKFYFKE